MADSVETIPNKPGKKKAEKHEIDAFVEKYETYADVYGDPVEMAFRIMADSTDEEVQLRAADMLMSYRYPRIKAIQGVQGQNGPQFAFNINIGGEQKQLQAIDVTPRLTSADAAPAIDLSGILTDG
jgi:hypothetical protein